MSGENKSEGASYELEKYIQQVYDSIDSKHIVVKKYDEAVAKYLDMDVEALSKLGQRELFDASLALQVYVGYIQDLVTEFKIRMNWAKAQLDQLMIHTEFPQYTKHETKIPYMVANNPYAKALDEIGVVCDSNVSIMENKMYNIKRQAEILFEKGKRI